MELEVPYRGVFIEIHKDIDPYEPKSMPDIYIDSIVTGKQIGRAHV